MAVSWRLGLAAALAGMGGLGVAIYVAGRSGPGVVPPTQPPCPPGQVAIVLIAQGPGSVSGCGASTRGQVQVCPVIGEACSYSAWPDSGASFRGWQGPNGITASSPTISPAAEVPGFVRAIFDPPPGVVSTGPNGEFNFRPSDVPIPGVHFEWMWDHINVAGHWLSVPDFQL